MLFVLPLSSLFWFHEFISRPVNPAISCSLVVFSCICCRVWERRHISSAKSKSSNFCIMFHWIPLGGLITDFITQSITKEKRGGDSKHPWRTPVFTSNDSVRSLL